MKLIRREDGVILFVVLIILVVMGLGGAALMRSVEATNQVSGNLAFKIASVHAADVGIEKAVADLPSIVSSSADSKYPSGCSATSGTGCRYYPLALTVDWNGLPAGINWSIVQNISTTPDYAVRYIIDRMCSGVLPVTDVAGNCKTVAPSNGGTKKAGGVVFTRAGQVYYRITVRVDGPRATQSYVRAVFSR